MATGARVFNGCRALLAAARSTTPKSAAAATATTTAVKKKAAQKPTAKREMKPRQAGANCVFLKPYPVSPALGNFLGGVSEASRAEATKKIWEHIKINNRQIPLLKTVFICDHKLKTIFGDRDIVGIREIAKLLSLHFVKTA